MKISELVSPAPGSKHALPHEFDTFTQQMADLQQQRKAAANEFWALDHPTPEQTQEWMQLNADLDVKIRSLRKQHQHQAENLNIEDLPQAEQIWKTVATRCAHFLTVCEQSGHLLYRGLRSGSPTAFVGHSPQQRRVKDSDATVSMMFDHALTELGFPAVRSNSIFVTANRYQAEGYGELYLIFPVDDHYAFTYTEEKDIVLERDQIQDMLDITSLERVRTVLNALAHTSEDTATQQEIYAAVLGTSTADFALNIGNINYNVLEIPPAYKNIITPASLDWRTYVDAQKFNTKYQPQQTDLGSAMRRKVEIYVHGEYHALRANYWEPFVRRELGIPDTKLVW